MNLKWKHALSLVCFAGLTFAGDGDAAPAPAPAATQPAQATGPAAGGMVYTTDQARGTSNLPDDLREALASTVNTSSEGLKEQVHSDGTVVVDLKGRFQSAMVVTIAPDGQLKTSCVSSEPQHSCQQHPKPEPEQK